MDRNFPLQFNYIPYPLWRRRWPVLVKPLVGLISRAAYPVKEDRRPPADPVAMTDYLIRYRLLPDLDMQAIYDALATSEAEIEHTSVELPSVTAQTPDAPVRLPAQWEPMESVIVAWPVLYPPLWDLHAQMVEAIAPVAEVVITVPAPMWGHAAWLYLAHRGRLGDLIERVRFFHLPTDDIWVRDYGPIVGLDAEGKRAAFDATYDHLPNYPQTLDDVMPLRWAAHTGTPVYPLRLHTEGGNLWSDGAGTLIMTRQIFHENPGHDRESLERYLHTVFDFDKLIITPRLMLEETGHVDLLVKPVDAGTMLVSAPTTRTSMRPLEESRRLFMQETNARGERYRVIELPTPPLYMNWFAFPIRRSYTNSLTVNGRVLVPVYGVEDDERALRIYEDAMLGYTVVPIDCTTGANGGGAVHCMTKEIPLELNHRSSS